MCEYLGSILSAAIILAVPAVASLSPAATAEINVAVHVSGIEKQSGAVYAGLYDASGWKGGHFIMAVHVPVTSGDITLDLTAPAPGRYAIRLFHDLNGNGKLDKNFFGIPQEPYAFSNNASGSMGPPDFDAAAFDVTAEGAKQEIHMQ